MASEEWFKKLHSDATAALVNATRTAGQIAGEDLGFLRTSNPKLAKALDKQHARLLSLARGLTRSASDGTNIRAPNLSFFEDVDDEWRRIVDVVDNLLEKADVCLDEYTGVIKKDVSSGNGPIGAKSTQPSSKQNRNRNIPKPQLFFKNVTKNNEKSAFRPLLRFKPHALKPLKESIGPAVSEIKSQEYPHPYETEIQQSNYPKSLYAQAEPILSRPFESTTATYVDTLQGVQEMLSELKQAPEIAVDLEHHDARSYVGLVSLMQISTREKDWIVDTLKPWREDLQILNEVFADPNIVKVFHGAFMDIVWLQRDLGLYVVGLFDTFHAAAALNYPKRSLAFLLQKFVNFNAQKQFQLADWRLRPLTKDMFEYARSDTHFLLYVYDNLRNKLLQNSAGSENLIDTVKEESKKVALQRYERAVYDAELGMGPQGWYQMLIRQAAIFNKEQFAVFKAIHKWRDDVARKEDESVQYVMQNNSLYGLAREMPLQIPQLLGCLSHVSDPVRKRVSELLSVIAKAKTSGVNGPEMKDVLREHPATVEYEARKEGRRKEVQAAKQPTLAEIAKRENFEISGDHLKADASVFWGPTINGLIREHVGEAIDSMSSSYALQVPLPNLTAEIFATEGDGQVAETTPIAPPEHAYIKKQQENIAKPTEDEVFTIREKGGPKKRKAQDHDAGPTNLEDEASANADEMKLDPTSPKSRKKRKKARKGRKAGKRNSSGGEELEENGSEDEEGFEPDSDPEDPFDYTTAPSVLYSKPSAAAQARAPAFDPYKKVLNTPKGLGRARKETAGMSATFKK